MLWEIKGFRFQESLVAVFLCLARCCFGFEVVLVSAVGWALEKAMEIYLMVLVVWVV